MNDLILLGLIGHPVAHSLSPAFHQAALRYCQIAGEYKLFDVEASELKEKIGSLTAQGLKGFNVTIPHKTAVLKLLDEAAPEVKLIGAVNTVKVNSNGQLSGYNTDALGFKLAFKSQCGSVAHADRALILGYGGSAKAVLVGLGQLGFTEVQVAGRNNDKLHAFISAAQERFNNYSACSVESLIGLANMRILPYENNQDHQPELIVNTIPFGLDTEDSLPAWVEAITGSLPSNCKGIDIVYRKDLKPPPFAKSLRDRGLSSQDGIEMLVQQARASFEIWTARKVPSEVMKAALPQY